jgi:hypothetical protein
MAITTLELTSVRNTIIMMAIPTPTPTSGSTESRSSVSVVETGTTSTTLDQAPHDASNITFPPPVADVDDDGDFLPSHHL